MAQLIKSKTLNEKGLILILAAIQFTTILDFLIIMPLGPQYMRVFDISPAQFGLIVSAYAISAGLSGVCSALFLDGLDRKKALVILYSGFIFGTFLCAIAPGYLSLIAARAIAGAFGGVVGALNLAIIGDTVPEERRGRAMGMLMSSFSIASICGVPVGLLLATQFSWHIPFLALAFLSCLVLFAIIPLVPSLKGHLENREKTNPLQRLLSLLLPANHQIALLFTAALTMTGFLIFPHISNYLVLNVGLSETQLPLVYLCGGFCTVFSMNLIGRWSDKVGKPKVFIFMSLAAILPIFSLTNLFPVPLLAALTVRTIFMICMSGRMVPAMAMLTSTIEAKRRGGFMAINAAVQQFASGIAALASGHIMSQNADGKITGYGTVGFLSIILALACIYLSRFLKILTDKPVDIIIIE